MLNEKMKHIRLVLKSFTQLQMKSTDTTNILAYSVLSFINKKQFLYE